MKGEVNKRWLRDEPWLSVMNKSHLYLYYMKERESTLVCKLLQAKPDVLYDMVVTAICKAADRQMRSFPAPQPPAWRSRWGSSTEYKPGSGGSTLDREWHVISGSVSGARHGWLHMRRYWLAMIRPSAADGWGPLRRSEILAISSPLCREKERRTEK